MLFHTCAHYSLINLPPTPRPSRGIEGRGLGMHFSWVSASESLIKKLRHAAVHRPPPLSHMHAPLASSTAATCPAQSDQCRRVLLATGRFASSRQKFFKCDNNYWSHVQCVRRRAPHGHGHGRRLPHVQQQQTRHAAQQPLLLVVLEQGRTQKSKQPLGFLTFSLLDNNVFRCCDWLLVWLWKKIFLTVRLLNFYSEIPAKICKNSWIQMFAGVLKRKIAYPRSFTLFAVRDGNGKKQFSTNFYCWTTMDFKLRIRPGLFWDQITLKMIVFGWFLILTIHWI